MRLGVTAVVSVIVTQIGCRGPQAPEANTFAPCALASFLYAHFPAYRDLSCVNDGGTCLLAFEAGDYDGTLVCGAHRFMRLNAASSGMPCVAPVLFLDKPRGEWWLLLDNVSTRLVDGGVSSQTLLLEAPTGGLGQFSAASLPNLPIVTDADNNYLRQLLLSGIHKCQPGPSPTEDLPRRPKDGGLGRREESKQEMLERMYRLEQDRL